VDFFAFDKAYVERLRNGDPATEHHFFVYFEKLLNIKLRSRNISPDRIEDLKQETFIRVIAAVRKEGVVRQPERFGAFVNSICNNVLLEHYRSLGKNQQMEETNQEIPDEVLDLEGMMVSKQFSERVRKILSALPARDRDLLRAVFLEERDKDTVCREIGVDRNYLRVLLHRAKDKFKAVYEKEGSGALPWVTGFGN
jgi:RNA polymerase sigma-70 factor, ECF subfamily